MTDFETSFIVGVVYGAASFTDDRAKLARAVKSALLHLSGLALDENDKHDPHTGRFAPKNGALDDFAKKSFANPDSLNIPREKFVNYALNLNSPKGHDKAVVFKKALGYTQANADELITALRKAIPKFETAYKGIDKWGLHYQTIVKIKGPNGKFANVLLAWIKRNSENHISLSSVYVTNKEARKK